MFERFRNAGPQLAFFRHPEMSLSESGFLYAKDGGGGGGGGGGRRRERERDEDDDEEQPRRRDPLVTAAKYGSDVNVMARHIDELEGDNYKLRSDKRKLTRKVEDLEDQLPPEGSVSITADQAKALEAYEKLGKPEDLAKLQEKVTGLESTNAKNQREQRLRDVADSPAPGKKFDLDVFRDLDAKIPGIEYEQREVAVEGSDQKQKVWFAKWKEGEGTAATQKESEVLKLYSERFPKFMPSLLVNGSGGSNNADNSLPENFDGALYPEQIPGGQQPSQNGPDIAGTFFQSRYGHLLPQQGK